MPPAAAIDTIYHVDMSSNATPAVLTVGRADFLSLTRPARAPMKCRRSESRLALSRCMASWHTGIQADTAGGAAAYPTPPTLRLRRDATRRVPCPKASGSKPGANCGRGYHRLRDAHRWTPPRRSRRVSDRQAARESRHGAHKHPGCRYWSAPRQLSRVRDALETLGTSLQTQSHREASSVQKGTASPTAPSSQSLRGNSCRHCKKRRWGPKRANALRETHPSH
jgi:hypothetical protein